MRKAFNRFAFTVLSLFSLSLSVVHSQDLTGIWKGYFLTESGEYYKLEFQVVQNGAYGVTGVSYSYLDVRFYGKATMTGSFIKSSSSFRIREIRTVEVKSSLGGATCIMNYNFKYSRSGKEEFLEGTYLGKYESKYAAATGTWGDCGNGKVFLRKVNTTDFYVEPFLKNRIRTTPVIVNEPPVKKDTVKVVKTPVTKLPTTKPTTTKPPVSKPIVKTTTNPTGTKTVVKPPTKPITRPVTTVVPKDTAKKITTPVVKPEVVKEPTPSVILNRTNELVKVLVVKDPKVTVKIYDNGEIDGDTISVYLDKKLVLSSKRLTASPLIVSLNMDEDNNVHELTMVA
jgi:hypothetical protein